MKIMTIKAEVNGRKFEDRFMVVQGVTPEVFREEWLKELEERAGVPDKGTLQVAVSSIGDDAEDNIERGRE